jgi:2-oxoglutarate dehydrogenase E2 component (dihydrolipoamide succinyltransferase)
MLTRILSAARVAASGVRALPLAALARAQPLPAAAAAAAARRALSAAAGDAHVLKVPGMGDSITEGALVKWLKKKGDYVALDEIVLVIETDKVAVDVRAPLAGTLEETLANVGDTVAVGAALAKINPKGSAAAPSAAAAAPPPKAAAPTPAAAAAAPAPVAAAAAAPPAPKAAAAPAAAAPAAAAPAAAAGSREESRVKMTRMRLRIAQRCVPRSKEGGGRAQGDMGAEAEYTALDLCSLQL